MRHIRIPLLAVALSLMVTGMAFAQSFDLPGITSWTSGIGAGCAAPPCPGLSYQGGGGAGSGFGDVLIGPLYDVRTITDPNLPGAAGSASQPQVTLISIVNTDPDRGVLARLRFREWRRSFECLDLDIVLTTNDVWVAQVSLPSGSSTPRLSQPLGAGSRYVSTVPNSLTDPLVTSLIPAAPDGINFSTLNIETGDITRCQYGYYEVIGEERIGAPNGSWVFPRLGLAERDVPNVLMGTNYIVRVAQAISHQYNLEAIANFSIDPAGIWSGIGQGTTTPNLKDSVQGGGSPIFPNAGFGGLDNLEGLLSKRFIDFQYIDQGEEGGYSPIDTSLTPMSTSVVVTFPTKWAHYSATSPFITLGISSPADDGAPFTGYYETRGDGEPYGEVVTFAIYDRSENPLTPPGCPISPCPSTTLKRLPWEVNIIGLRPVSTADETVYDFRNNYGLATANNASGQTFFSGWTELDLSPESGLTGDTRNFPQGKYPAVFNFYNNFFNAYRGLPALGIIMTEFYNGSTNGYYGNTVPWQYKVDWRRVTDLQGFLAD